MAKSLYIYLCVCVYMFLACNFSPYMPSLRNHIFTKGYDRDMVEISPSNSMKGGKVISFSLPQPLSLTVTHAGNGNKGG